MRNKRPTQCMRVLAYMSLFGSITTLQAFADLGCARLASRISELKKNGYDIRSRYVKGENRFGESVYYKEYYLGKDVPNATTQTGT